MWRWMAALALVTVPWLQLAQAQPKKIPDQQAHYLRIKIDLNDYTVDANSGALKFGPGVPGFGPGGKGGQPMPQPGTPGQPGTVPPPVSNEPPLWVEVHLPIIGMATAGQTGYQIKYKLDSDVGTSYVLSKDIKPFNQPNLKLRFDIKKKIVDKSVTEIGLLDLAEFALQRGLMKEFHDTMDELTKKFDKNPRGQTYAKVHAAMQNAPKQDDPVAAKLGLPGSYKNEATSAGGHYALFTQLDRDSTAVKERLQQLERTYESFYYWFALRGKVLPQPKHRLIVVLEDTAAAFKAKTAAFTAKPLSQAGFLAQAQNVIFLSREPVDPVYAFLDTNNQNYCKSFGISHNLLLKGKIPPGLDNDNAAKLSTRILVQKMLEEDIGRVTTTHEAVQQLLAAADLMPRNVLTAEWLRDGLSSFFETPRLAFYDCSTLPNLSNLVYFKHHRQTTGKLSDEQMAMVLYKTVTDDYFSQASIALRLAEIADNRIHAYQAATERLQIAQASSWALTYYLMHKNLDQVFDYCTTLRQLPREIEYSPPVLATSFGKAFGLAANNDPSNPLPLDLQGLEVRAASWYDYMNSQAVALDVQLLEGQWLQDLANPQKKTAESPPGGFGGFGGTGK